MGAKCGIILVLFVFINNTHVQSHPIPKLGIGETVLESPSSPLWSPLLALAFTVACAIVLLGCLNCCKQRAGFKEFRNSVSESNVNNVGLDFVNPLQEIAVTAQPSRYSIFSSLASASSTSGAFTGSKQPESVVTFEPLPKVLPHGERNPRLPYLDGNTDGVGVTGDWLDDKDFPREQLHYLRECGQGWFGKVVEGEARGIVANSGKIHRVFVRILKEDATAAEQAFFLREAKPYRHLSHPNVLKLVGRCLENVPFLLVFEACSNGDLKSYLKQNAGNREALVHQGVILRMAVDIANGLSYMLQHAFVHTDIAARNCLVSGDLRVKVGDYGTSLQNYKEEYYFNGDIALPIRWCAPETLKCTETAIEPQQVTGASCIWSYGVLLWELEEWGELPYKELSNDQVISRVFGGEELRLARPSSTTPCAGEMYEIMKECWKDYADRPSFLHVTNALSALLHRFKNNDFDSRWQSSKPNTIAVTDNDGRPRQQRSGTSLASKSDNDSGIDLDNPKLSKGVSLLQLQSSSMHRAGAANDECSSDSPASSRRFSNSSTADLFSSPVSAKQRSPSLENLHGSLDNVNAARSTADGFESTWYKEQRHDSESSAKSYQGERKLDFRLGLVSSVDGDSLWNHNQPLFQSDSLQEDSSLSRRVDSLGTDTEDEIWRRRIERGEFTEKVKEKSKSVADLMILTHIDCSESSESDSLPSFHSRQSSFNKQCRRGSKSNAPLSLLNSLSFGSESNLPVVEKDQQFQDTLKKIQIAKISGAGGGGGDDSLTVMSLQPTKDAGFSGGHFLANEASKKRYSLSSHVQRDADADADVDSRETNELPLSDIEVDGGDQSKPTTASNFLENEARPSGHVEQARTNEYRSAFADGSSVSDNFEAADTLATSICYDVLYSSSSSNEQSSSPNDADSVVIGPSESDTLEYFKGLKTTLLDAKPISPQMETRCEDAAEESGDGSGTLNDFLNDSSDDYFYKCDDEIAPSKCNDTGARFRSQCCDYCYVKCHFSSNECLRCKDEKCADDNCSCESLEKFRDCGTLNSCPFQSDDSGRGTDQINSGDGSSDKSLEGSISVQMNEVKNRLEDVIAKFAADDSDNSCSSLEEDKESFDRLKIEEVDADAPDSGDFVVTVQEADDEPHAGEFDSRRGSLLAVSEDNEFSSVEEDTCVGLRSQSEDSGHIATSSSGENAPGSFVKVEQLFFTVDPKLEKEMEELKSGDAKQQPEPNTAYEISDILEGLSEPISLPYSVNERYSDNDDDGTGSGTDSDASDDSSNRLASPIDDDYGSCPKVDENFVEAIRNELLEKLPNVSTLAIVEPEEETNENTNITIEYNTYPLRLSPIQEEDEQYSSMSSIRSSSEDESSLTKYFIPDDVLVVNTETHEASIVDDSDSYNVRHKLNETYEIDENDEDTIEMADNLDSDSLPTPDSLSPGTSSKTGAAHLSYSSSESGNLSDVFLSPSSSKNFDEFDTDRSPPPGDARHLNTPENMLYSADLDHRRHYHKAMLSIDELLNKCEDGSRGSSANDESGRDFIDPVCKNRDESWLKSFFQSYSDTTSLVDFNSVSDTSETECRSLPADFKSQHWPPADQLVSNEEAATPTEHIENSCTPVHDEKCDFHSSAAVANMCAFEPTNDGTVPSEHGGSSTLPDPTQTKAKNSLALFGNTTKQIRNFQVSLVKDDNYSPSARTSPTSPKYVVDSYLNASVSAQSSEKTWKAPLTANSFLTSQNLENLASKENVNDFMSTSFIENGSQDGSIDDKDENIMKSDSESDEGEIECTNDEFEWKKQKDTVEGGAPDNIAENSNSDEDDDDDEELADFVPYSWNVEAIPLKSALRNKEKKKTLKKNVSFKKQKYHCVYEYPKEEVTYVRTYEDLLQDRVFSLWSMDRDCLYGDYSSFSDWELDDCEEQACADDVLPYPIVSSTSPKNSIPNKLTFYTIGAYDIDTTKSNMPDENSAAYFLSSPGCSVLNNSVTSSLNHVSSDISKEKEEYQTPFSECGEKCVSNDANNFKGSAEDARNFNNNEYIDLPSPGLGELKHTKNRLKLDLNCTSSSNRSDEKTSEKSELRLSKNAEEDILKNNTEESFEFGLNFKSCDISPVVELPKSLTSASVA